MNQQALSAAIWSVADLLRGDYKQSKYGRVILPLTVLRKLNCILAPTKTTVLEEKAVKEEFVTCREVMQQHTSEYMSNIDEKDA